MELSTNFTFAPKSSSTSSTFVVGNANATPEEAAATLAATYLGYVALLSNAASDPNVTTANYSDALTAIQKTLFVIKWNLLPQFQTQTGSDFQAIVTDVQTMLSTLGVSENLPSQSIIPAPSLAQMSAYVKIYEDTDASAPSPVGNILSFLQNHGGISGITTSDYTISGGTITYATSGDAAFATTMFLLSANLPGVLKTGLSADLESILSASCGIEDSASWMSDFLSGYISAKSDEVGFNPSGSLIAALLPPKGTSSSTTPSTTPNYDAFYDTFVGSSSLSYAGWQAPTGLTKQQALNGIQFWYNSNTIPS